MPTQTTIDASFERAKKAMSLAKDAEGRAVPELLRLIRDSNAEVRSYAVESLSNFRAKPKVLSALKVSLADPDELVRVETAETLGALGSATALPWLRRALKDKSSLVRSYVAGAIGALGAVNDKKYLLRTLMQEQSARAKIGLFVALYELGMQGALIALLSLYREDDYRDRIGIAENIIGIVEKTSDCRMVLSAMPLVLAEEKDKFVAGYWRKCQRAMKKRIGHAARKNRR